MENQILKEEQVDKYTVKVYIDNEPYNPREDDNVTKMVCFHSRYSLGDIHKYNHKDYSGWN